MADYMDCYKKVASTLSLRDLPNIDVTTPKKPVVAVQARRAGKDGIYFFTENAAYFYALGAPHFEGHNGQQIYYFEARVPGHPPSYVDFHKMEIDNGTVEYSIGYGKTPLKGATKQQVLENGDALDSESRHYWRDSLLKSIEKNTDRDLKDPYPDEHESTPAKRQTHLARLKDKVEALTLCRTRLGSDSKFSKALDSRIQSYEAVIHNMTAAPNPADAAPKPAKGQKI